jgi:hypothetical protein
MMQDFIDKNHNPYEKTMKAEDIEDVVWKKLEVKA